MKRVIRVKLDPRDIDRALKEIKDYQNELNEKVSRFIAALLEEGVKVASARLASTRGDNVNATVDSYYVDSSGDMTKAVIALNGEDCLFIEFGSGVVFNSVDHPLAAQMGYGPGTYPGQTHVPVPGYWYYGDGKLSVGTEATMPMYGAAEHMRNIISAKAKEIFRS